MSFKWLALVAQPGTAVWAVMATPSTMTVPFLGEAEITLPCLPITLPISEGESTTKTIYVGSNNYLRALSATEMSIAELNEKIKAGAIVHDDGTIEVISTSTSDPQENQETSKPTDDQPNDTASPNNTTPDVKPDENNANPPENEPEYDYTPIVIIAIVIVGACSAVYIVMKKKRRAAMLEEEGGDE